MTSRPFTTTAVLLVLCAAGCKGSSADRAGTGTATKTATVTATGTTADAGAMTLLERVAGIVIPSCAVAGCHDAISKTHAMDLSSPERIVESWIRVPGYDHCTGRDTPRIIPNDAAGSLVMMKVEGKAVCAQSQRMPLPPRAALTPEQITVIRQWIQAGAPDDGRAPRDAGVTDAGVSDGSVSDAGWPLCTAVSACPPGLECTGISCGTPWECLSHYDETHSHPCSEEMADFCGCDGKTFQASVTCPDRPWLHAGACDDGFSCTSGMVECGEPPPQCPAGKYPSVSGTCWGECVPLDSCRCLYHWMCPELALNTCINETRRCGPNPNLADAGMSDAGTP